MKLPILEYRQLHELFQKAELAISRHEKSKFQNTVIPSINELRYAGNHLLRSLNADSDNVSHEELEKAKRHCKRAIYDASDIFILALLDEINSFHEDYKDVVISDVVMSYNDISVRVKKIQKFITENKIQIDPVKVGESARDKYYEICHEYSCELEEIYNMLDLARDELNKLKSRQVIEKRRHQVLLFLGVLSIIVAIVLGT